MVIMSDVSVPFSPLSSNFLGDAKRFPMVKEGRVEVSPLRKWRLQIRECSCKSPSLNPIAFNHCTLLDKSAGKRCIDTA